MYALGIEEYLSQIQALLDRYAAASFVVSVSVTTDRRPGEQGFVSGKVQFTDGSTLYFREYLDADTQTVEKLMYVYHYQDTTGKMILRYDNAAHRPSPHSFDHKHDATGIKNVTAPTLEIVLMEIVELQGWAQ